MADLPETPFDGVIIARDVMRLGTDPSTIIVHLAIKHEADQESDEPRVVLYRFQMDDDYRFYPESLLREGHRVKVKKLAMEGAFIRVSELTFDPATLAKRETTAPEK